MIYLKIIGAIYLASGFIYAFYILIQGVDPWYLFPINMIGGPIVWLYNYYKFNVKKRLPK
jgi:hypothetical protein